MKPKDINATELKRALRKMGFRPNADHDAWVLHGKSFHFEAPTNRKKLALYQQERDRDSRN